ncbi:ribosome maturation factor RimM [Helicobacter pylori]|uniref:ribosome maturation factor RimM n=1 Tax=Helicobacter pylori TaxID=210 RepID=UPI002300D07A|nr:ribosome maturation factor RimM [Helicobacter pylori]WCB34712.1 ribosome maturation factor RimM [Helicobacter pylori]WHT46414.1 ribosome maturation factor RimM [Helicobacter pylori]
MVSMLLVGRIGKSVGLNGGLRLHLESDFPECLKKGVKVSTAPLNAFSYASMLLHFKEYTIHSYEHAKNLLFLETIHTPEKAKELTNLGLFMSEAESKKLCVLKDGEFFYCDLVGLSVVEENEILGKVIEIQRISQIDYFLVETARNLVEKGLAKIFLIPYRDFYIKEILLQDKKITTNNAKTLLENS